MNASGRHRSGVPVEEEGPFADSASPLVTSRFQRWLWASESGGAVDRSARIERWPCCGFCHPRQAGLPLDIFGPAWNMFRIMASIVSDPRSVLDPRLLRYGYIQRDPSACPGSRLISRSRRARQGMMPGLARAPAKVVEPEREWDHGGHCELRYRSGAGLQAGHRARCLKARRFREYQI